jgi:hypothetical protein
VWFSPPHTQTRFRAYDTIEEGVANYLNNSLVKDAIAAAEGTIAADPAVSFDRVAAAYVGKLKQPGNAKHPGRAYATAPDYARDVAAEAASLYNRSERASAADPAAAAKAGAAVDANQRQKQ